MYESVYCGLHGINTGLSVSELDCEFANLGRSQIIEYFQTKRASQQWNLSCAEWPNKEGGACFVSWMEEGHLCDYLIGS